VENTGVLVTELNVKMKDRICRYCGNNVGGCVADVPWYAVSGFASF
jgi:hypothetical protein